MAVNIKNIHNFSPPNKCRDMRWRMTPVKIQNAPSMISNISRKAIPVDGAPNIDDARGPKNPTTNIAVERRSIAAAVNLIRSLWTRLIE